MEFVLEFEWTFVCFFDKTHDIWPLIVLKAYAKYLGTYEMLLQGSVEDTLRDFTGKIDFIW